MTNISDPETLPPFVPGGDDTRAVVVDRLVKRYGDFEAVRGVSFDVAAGRDVRVPRPQRRRQVDDDQDAVHPAHADRRPRDGRRLRRGHRARCRSAAASAWSSRTRRSTSYLTAEREPALPRRAVRRAARPRSPSGCDQVLEMVGLWDRRNEHRADVLGRHEAPARDRPGPAALAAGAVPRRADGRASTRRPAPRSGPTSTSCKSAEDITIFLTTHYMDEAEYCDRIAIMDQGQIVVIDTPEALKASVGKDRVADLDTDDDARAIEALQERFGIEAADERGRGDVPRGRRRAVRAPAVRRARRADPVGQRGPAHPRRRVHEATPGRTIRDAEASGSERNRFMRHGPGRRGPDDRRTTDTCPTAPVIASVGVPERPASRDLGPSRWSGSAS